MHPKAEGIIRGMARPAICYKYAVNTSVLSCDRNLLAANCQLWPLKHGDTARL